LLAAFIGMGTGMSMAGIITSTISPTMVSDMNWNPADFAKVHGLAILMALVFPFIGRLADVLGVRWTALIGQTTLPLAFLAYSRMDGSLSTYAAIFAIQSLICVTTTSTVYSRLAVQYVEKARGLALAIVVSGPAIAGVILAPQLNRVVEEIGWRAGYQMMAVIAAIGGLTCFLLIPASAKVAVAEKPKRSARQDYPLIFRSPAFWVLAGSMLLCNLPQTLLQVQGKALALDNGIAGRDAAMFLVAPLWGMFIGRFIAGLALDRFQPYLVAFVTLGLPSLGLFVLASDYDAPIVLVAAMFGIGLLYGAEGDIIAYLVARRFGVAIYSSVMGLMTAFISISTSFGAWLLGTTMAANDNHFATFLTITGVAVLVGAGMLLLLRFVPKVEGVGE
jgi:MFS family permease